MTQLAIKIRSSFLVCLENQGGRGGCTLSQKLFQNISLIKTLVALCPLMGLLGTVTGMIHVFDVMAQTGTGNARLMASGISMATIPTMSGMVAALSGLYFGKLLENKAKREVQKVRQNLVVTLEG